jgi:hypothetical protein
MTEETKPEADNFEISLRILGNEIIAMKMSSQSKTKNWAAFGIISLIVLIGLANAALPLIQQFTN